VYAQPVVLDSFESLDQWKVITPDGVAASIHSADGIEGHALRLDFEFQTGSGFCVIRRELAMPLAPNYCLTFALRADAPVNNLEFKLVDPSGDNVWWVNRRAFEFPREWQTVVNRARTSTSRGTVGRRASRRDRGHRVRGCGCHRRQGLDLP